MGDVTRLASSTVTNAVQALKGTDGAAHVLVQPGSTNAYGAHPATYYTESALSGSLTAAATATQIVEVGDATAVNSATFSVSVLTGTTPSVNVYGVLVGSTYETQSIRIINLNTGTETTQATAVGLYAVKFNGSKFKKLRLVYENTGAGNVTTVGATGWL